MTVVFALFSVLMSFGLKAQRSTVNLDLVGLVDPVVRVGFAQLYNERLAARGSLEVGKYRSKDITSYDQEVEVFKVKGWGAMLDVRYYPLKGKKVSPAGFFFGLHYRVRRITEEYTDFEFINGTNDVSDSTFVSKGSTTHVGLNAGYHVPFSETFGVELLAGYGLGSGEWENEPDRSGRGKAYAMEFNDLENTLRVELSLVYVLRSR